MTTDAAGAAETSPAGSAACGGCGYAVRGLPGFVCPECGGDLRDVGIAVPGKRLFRPRRGTASGRGTRITALGLLAAAALLLAPAAVLYAGLARLFVWHEERDILRLSNGQSIEYVLTAAGGGYRTPTRKDRLTIDRVGLGDQPRTLEIDLNSFEGQYEYGKQIYTGTVDEGFVGRAMGLLGSSPITTDVFTLAIVARRGGSLSAVGNPGGWANVSGSTTDVASTPNWVALLALGLWLPAWYSLRRRLLPRPVESPAAAETGGAAPPATPPVSAESLAAPPGGEVSIA